MKRVVVTGVGAITPIGNNCNEFWSSIKAGKCGIDKVTAFDVENYKCQIAAEIKDFEPSEYIDKKEARKMDRYTQFGVVAASEAFVQPSFTAIAAPRVYAQQAFSKQIGCTPLTIS